ncbi:MAG: Holliday junction resolvase RuvX [Kiritimatiellae bacterium]|jgi:putative Holliday junction resolvase|nr:Holliday junction resolvase RuvX [Kiritimatiellia bacterium]
MKLLGIDYGIRRLGIAISDPLGMLATPFRTVNTFSDEQSLQEICNLIEETKAEKLVIGLPLNMDGTEGPMVLKVREFIEKLKLKTDLPIEFSDERLSSSLVERTLIEADMSREKRKNVRDKLAAQVILQGYIDANENDIL